ncbi:MAG: hypothetical protein AB8H79_14460 [Myxococcota bacterium]
MFRRVTPPHEPYRTVATRWASPAMLVVICAIIGGMSGRASATEDSVWLTAPPGAEAVDGWLLQEAVPQLRARLERARVRLASLEAAQRGRATLGSALPEIDPDSLHDPASVMAHLRALDHRAEVRAGEAATLLPSSRAATTAKRLLTQTHAAEDRADGAERSVLVSARAWIKEQPWMSKSALAATLAPLERQIDTMRGLDEADPASEAQLAAGVYATLERDRYLGLARALREHRLTGRPLPDWQPDVERLGSATLAGPALERLAWVRQFLPSAERRALDDLTRPANQRRMQEVRDAIAAITDSEPTRSADELAAAEAVLAAAASAMDRAPPALRPLALSRWELAGQRLEHIKSAPAEPTSSTADEAAAAREVHDAAAEKTALLIEKRAPSELRLQELASYLQVHEQMLSDVRDSSAKTLSEARSALATVTSGSPRPSGLDRSYADLRTLVSTSRTLASTLDQDLIRAERMVSKAAAKAASEDQEISLQRAALPDVRDPAVRASRFAAITAWADARAQEGETARTLIDLLRGGRESALVQLREASELRRGLSGWVSVDQRRLDNEGLFTEAIDEVSLLGPTYLATQRERVRAAQHNPLALLNVGVLTNLLLGSAWFLLSGLVWFVARRYADSLVAGVMQRITTRWGLRSQELQPLRSPVRRALVTFVDVVAAWALFGVVPDGLPELSVLLLLVFEVQLLRLELALYELLVAERPTYRPAMFRFATKAWRLGWRSVFALGLFFAVYRVLHAFTRDVLSAWATDVLVSWVLFAAFFILVIGLLYLWAPIVRARVKAHGRESWITQLLGADPPTVLLGAPQAIGGLTFVTVVGLRALAFRIARQGFVARWFAAFDRYRLGRSDDAAEEENTALADEVRAALVLRASTRALEDRPTSRAALTKALSSWKAEKRQGLVAVLGDSGEGRGVLLRGWQDGGGAGDLPVRWVDIDHRLVTERDALAWLAKEFQLSDVPDDVDAAVEALGACLEPSVLIVTGLHLAFLRTVGGFNAVRALMEVFHADGRERFWVMAFYRPSWRYLERLGSSLNTQLVRSVVDIAPLDADALHRLTESLAQKSGYTLDFDLLVSTGALAGDADIEYRRAEESYYRLLEKASGGNPAVALEMWLGCLTLHPPKIQGDLPSLQVAVSRDIRVAPRNDLGDDQLFVLAAIRTQGEVGESDLAEVLNMRLVQVRAIVRQLLSRGILERGERGLHLARLWMPSITMTLRRKHFLHWGGT